MDEAYKVQQLNGFSLSPLYPFIKSLWVMQKRSLLMEKSAKLKKDMKRIWLFSMLKHGENGNGITL